METTLGAQWSSQATLATGAIPNASAGLPTRVIRQVLPCVHGDRTVVDVCVAGLLHEQLRGLDERITHLQQARSALVDLLPA